MAVTVQTLLARLARRIDPRVDNTGQEINDNSVAVTITGAANNGSGLIRITAANHGFVTGNYVTILGVTGTTEANNTTANPYWVVTYISSSTFDLQSSTFTNNYVSGGTATGALVGAVGGSFPAQRLLDIYNDARYVLFQALKERFNFDKDMISKEVGAIVTVNQAFTFTLTGSVAIGPKPTGFLDFIACNNATNVPLILLPTTLLQEVLRGVNPQYTQSASNIFIFDVGQNLTHYGTLVTTLSTYQLIYLGITAWTLTDVVGYGGASLGNESYNDRYHVMLLEVAQAISKEMGRTEVLALAKSLLGMKQ